MRINISKKGKHMKHKLIVLAAILGSIVLAQTAQTTYKLVINNKAFSSNAIVVKGETYVPLKALQASGIRSSLKAGTLTLTLPNATNAGGATQVAALEGCLNEWLLNGIWRFRVISVTPYQENEHVGWTLKMELRNATKANGFALSGTGYESFKLAFNDGNTLDPYNVNDLRDPPIPPGAGVVSEVTFENIKKVQGEPQKLLLFIRPDAFTIKHLRESVGIAYSVPDPSFRVKLDCKK
jgi:hypothetical protein